MASRYWDVVAMTSYAEECRPDSDIAADAGGSEYIRCAKDGLFKGIAGCGALE